MLYATEILIYFFTFLIAGIVLKWFSRGSNKHEGRRYPPALPALPFIGSLPFLTRLEKLPEHLMKTADRLGPIFTFYSGRKLTVVLNNKEVIVEALVKNATEFADRPPFYTEKYVDNVKLNGIAFKPYNESFKKFHKITLSILKEFGFGVKDISERLILEDVEGLLEEIKGKKGKAFDVKTMLTKAVSNMVVAILFGKRFTLCGTDHETLVENIDKNIGNMDPIFDVVPIVRFIPMYRKKLIATAESMVVIRRCIAEGIKSALAEEEENFVKRFIQKEGPSYDPDELLFILRDLCGASMETIATTIRYAMVFLANNSEIQDRLHQEIDSVISKDTLPSLDDKQHLPYTEAVILETMRIKTVVPFAIPHAVTVDKELSGYFIPKNTQVLVNLQSVHMNPKVWKDPEVFRPERFLDEENRIIGREMVIPFSLGKRSCPGENLARKSLFLFLTALVLHFDIRPPEGHDSISVSDVCSIVFGPSAFDARLIPRWCV